MTDSVPEKLGKYKIIEEVGRGGFAAVYKAVDTTLERTVALKVLAPHLLWDPTFVQRFLLEARAAANLDHPNIVTIHEVSQIEGIYFIAMQFLAGRTLSQILQAEGPLPVLQVRAIIEQMASALDYAHARGFVHRDIKPSNVIVASDGKATLTDFGLVKALDLTEITPSGLIFGTPEYMSPEQAEGVEELDARSDIYSLGVVLYEMLAGRAPFVADTAPAVMYKHVHEPLPLDELPSDLPEGVVAVMEKALAKKREDRYQSAGEMAWTLTAAVEPKVERKKSPLAKAKQVFISHATADTQFAHRLADDLQRLGMRVWIAPDSIRPGESWVSAIERGLKESSYMVILLTPAALESKWVKKETDVAIAQERKGRIEVIPLDVKPCDVPLLLSSYQMVSFRHDYDAGLSQLATILDVGVTPSVPARPRVTVTEMVHILHLSDIHLGTASEARKYRTQLETDLRRELDISRLEYLVVSGDVATYSTSEEYKAAFELIDGLVKRFGLDSSRVVVVPGNHDVNWDLSEEAYPFVPKRKLPDKLPEGRYIPAGDVGALLCNDDLYRQRFAHFSAHFYKKVYSGMGYPLDYAEQGILHLRPDDRILFLALNSCWQIDHYYRQRASIYMEALARALDQLADGAYDDWLKIAVWHHPVTGPEMMNDEFLQLLTVHGFQICMHGHIHEAIEGYHKYDAKRDLYIVGAGTFGAPTREQAPGIPLQYNLLTLDSETHILTVETRKKEEPDGAWSADARWGNKNNPVPRYKIELK